MKLRIEKGNTFHQCSWVVYEGTDPIAEFWTRSDAVLFCKYKNLEEKRK